MNTAERFREIELFSHFSDEQIERLCRCTSQVRYPEGALVVTEGDRTLDAYLIDRGTVRVQRDTPFGTCALADLQGGDMFGETSFVDRSARSGDVLVLTEAVLFPFTSGALRAAAERDQRFKLALYWAFWKSLSQKLRKTNETLTRFDFSGRDVPWPRSSTDEPSTEFRGGIDAKQDLFREQKLSSLEINFLSTLSKEKRLAPGETLFREGDAGDQLYVVLDGRVEISKSLPAAGEGALAVMERGDYFGEMALIDREPRSADARAHGEGAVVLAIPSQVLSNILDPRKVSSLRLLKLLCELIAKRLRELNNTLITWFIFKASSGEATGTARTE